MKLRGERKKKKQKKQKRTSSTISSNKSMFKDYINPTQNDLESNQLHVEMESNHPNGGITADQIPLKNGSINKA